MLPPLGSSASLSYQVLIDAEGKPGPAPTVRLVGGLPPADAVPQPQLTPQQK